MWYYFRKGSAARSVHEFVREAPWHAPPNDHAPKKDAKSALCRHMRTSPRNLRTSGGPVEAEREQARTPPMPSGPDTAAAAAEEEEGKCGSQGKHFGDACAGSTVAAEFAGPTRPRAHNENPNNPN